METRSMFMSMPANAGSMIVNPKKVYTLGDSMVCLATDGTLWKCHRRQRGEAGYPIMYEIKKGVHVDYDRHMAALDKEDSILVTIQVMDDDTWGPRQDLDLIPPRVLRNIVEFLIENNSWVKSEGDARALMTTMSKHELMDCYLSWNGIQGFTSDILGAVDGIDKAKRGHK